MDTNEQTGKRVVRRRRDERLFVTLTDGEKQRIVAAADLDGISPTEWARTRLLEQAARCERSSKRANRPKELRKIFLAAEHQSGDADSDVLDVTEYLP